MSKHKLFFEDLNNSFHLSGSETSTDCQFKNCLFDSLHSKSFSKGVKNECSLLNASNAQKNMKKSKLDSNSPGPSSAEDSHSAIESDHVILNSDTKMINISEGTEVGKTTEEKNFSCAPPDSPEDSVVDKMEVDFFSMLNQKIPYSKQEDQLIIEYVLKGQNIFRVSSISLWKYLESKKNNPKRTYHSLKNRFMRNIKPYLFTTYRHFIKNKETVDNILLKFPELKKQMGIKDTLSKINHPTRFSPKLLKAKTQESSDANGRTTEARTFESDIEIDPIVQSSQESSQSNSLNGARKVIFGKKSILVSVSLIDRDSSESPVSSLTKMNERFKILRTKRKRNNCPTCGRYKLCLEDSDSSESDKDSDSMIPNSIDEGKMAPKNLEQRKFHSSLNNNQKANHKIHSSEDSGSNQNSQNLLNYDDEIYVFDKPTEDTNKDSSIICDSSKTLTFKEIKVEGVAKKLQIKEKSKNIISKKEVALGNEKQWADDNEIDIIYESTMAGFQKLIDADEEKMLFKKYLYKNRDSIDFNSDSEKNLDSYFLESSPEVETPTLTENYPISSQSSTSTTVFKSACSSHLAANMMKMLATAKDINKNC